MQRLPAKLDCEKPALEPGGRFSCRLLVYNPADRVDEVTTVVQGPFEPWATVEPGELALMPRTEGAFELTIDLPERALVEAGRNPLLVEVRPGLADTEPSIEELDIEVGRHTEVTVSLDQRTAEEPGAAVYAVLIDNRSNHRVSLSLEVDATVRSRIAPSDVALAPFQTVTATVELERDPDDHEPAAVTVRATGPDIDVRDQATWTPAVARPPEPRRRQEPAPAPDPPPRTSPPPPPASQPPPSEVRKRRWPAVVAVAVVAVAALLAFWYVTQEWGISVRDFEELAERPSPRVERDPWEWTWQAMLRGQGIDLGPQGIDGRFGPATREATVEFQRRVGLPVDGEVGAEEWTRMLERFEQRGRSGRVSVLDWHVEPATELLGRLGFEVEIAPGRPCAPVEGIVVGARSRNGTAVLQISDGPPC